MAVSEKRISDSESKRKEQEGQSKVDSLRKRTRRGKGSGGESGSSRESGSSGETGSQKGTGSSRESGSN